MFINRAGTLLVPFLTLYLNKKLGLGPATATLAMGAYGVGALAAGILGGHLADRFGRRVIMLIALFGGAGILLVFAELTSPAAILVASGTFALVVEMYRPAASAMIGDLVEPERRSHAFGLMYVAINLGFSVGPIVGGMLMVYSYRWLFWGDALTSAAYGLLILIAIRETLPSRQPAEAARAGGVSPPDESGNAGEEVSLSAAVKHILNNRPFMIFCFGTFCIAYLFMQTMSTFPLHMNDYGIGPEVYGRIIAINGMMIVCLQLPMTAIISRFDRSWVMIWGTVVMGVGFGLIAFAGNVWEFAGATMIWTFGEMMQVPLAPAIVTDFAPVAMRARYMGVFGMCWAGAMMIGAPVGGLVLEHFGGYWMWGSCAAVAVVSAVAYWSIRRAVRDVREVGATPMCP
ncbi:MAG: MFS transporter [Planctomycetes bacterium]|nr:MFS transporter [Planctomycetota bacterium]